MISNDGRNYSDEIEFMEERINALRADLQYVNRILKRVSDNQDLMTHWCVKSHHKVCELSDRTGHIETKID